MDLGLYEPIWTHWFHMSRMAHWVQWAHGPATMGPGPGPGPLPLDGGTCARKNWHAPFEQMITNAVCSGLILACSIWTNDYKCSLFWVKSSICLKVKQSVRCCWSSFKHRYVIQAGFAQAAVASRQLCIVVCFTNTAEDLVEFECIFLICSRWPHSKLQYVPQLKKVT